MSDHKITVAIYGFCLLVMSYFVFHIFHGERGLYSEEKLQIKINELSSELAGLQGERKELKWKIDNLGSGNGRVDPDLLTEYMRDLGYVTEDEYLFVE